MVGEDLEILSVIKYRGCQKTYIYFKKEKKLC